MRFLITGTAGFIGFNLARRLLDDGHFVTGIDAMTPYYDVNLKRSRHDVLRRSNAFSAHEMLLEDMVGLNRVVEQEPPDAIVHLAAQAGVRYSLENPRAYVDANLLGTFNVLEVARALKPYHLLMASTSSVYGANTVLPFHENERAAHPLTLYAATKRSTELMAHSQSHIWGVPITMFRFFTVYGPWGRPDMALFKFVERILANEPIDVYGQGRMMRDFTYIDDLVEAVARLIHCVPEKGKPVNADPTFDSLSPVAPFRVVNVGGGQPVSLLDFIAAIEARLELTARRNYLPIQLGDVPSTFAAAALLEQLTGYKPSTRIEAGVAAFVDWYKAYYRR